VAERWSHGIVLGGSPEAVARRLEGFAAGLPCDVEVRRSAVGSTVLALGSGLGRRLLDLPWPAWIEEVDTYHDGMWVTLLASGAVRYEEARDPDGWHVLWAGERRSCAAQRGPTPGLVAHAREAMAELSRDIGLVPARRIWEPGEALFPGIEGGELVTTLRSRAPDPLPGEDDDLPF
jgi:hypothetical protein